MSLYRRYLFVFIALVLVHAPLSAKTIGVELPSGTELTVQQFGAAPVRLLWLPSEFGTRGEPERKLAGEMAQLGLEVWYADLHEHYFIPPGRSSLEDIPLDDMVTLIDHARRGAKRLYLFSFGRGAALMLEAARLWQLARPDAPSLGGAIFIHPNLAAGIAEAGAAPTYRPIASATNLPIYIFQPLNSAKRWYLDGLVERLQQGGSDVITHLLPDVSDGFQLRPDATEYELGVRQRLPKMVIQASRLLAFYDHGPRPAVAEMPALAEEKPIVGAAALEPIPDSPVAPPLRLPQWGHAGDVDLTQFRGEVVLINFWATWCPPCVREIPSLGRLQTHFAGRPFRVISVDVGEEANKVEAFLQRVPAAFPVLLDPQGSVVKPWTIRAFPTSYLVNAEGRLRYGYYGGLEWDSDEVFAVVEGLLGGR